MRVIQNKSGAVALLAQTPLFSAARPESLTFVRLSEKSVYASFDAGEILYDAVHFPHAAALIVSGQAQCCGLAQSVTLNTFCAGDLFGLAAAFAPPGESLSRVTAQTRVKALILSQSLLRELIARDPAVAESYIAFLSNRVAFLNRKIAAFTAGEAVVRVAMYLAQLYRAQGSPFELPCTVSALCRVLDLARVSLYRAFDQLAAEGIAVRSGRQITVLHPDALLRFAAPQPNKSSAKSERKNES